VKRKQSLNLGEKGEKEALWCNRKFELLLVIIISKIGDEKVNPNS